VSNATNHAVVWSVVCGLLPPGKHSVDLFILVVQVDINAV